MIPTIQHFKAAPLPGERAPLPLPESRLARLFHRACQTMSCLAPPRTPKVRWSQLSGWFRSAFRPSCLASARLHQLSLSCDWLGQQPENPSGDTAAMTQQFFSLAVWNQNPQRLRGESAVMFINKHLLPLTLRMLPAASPLQLKKIRAFFSRLPADTILALKLDFIDQDRINRIQRNLVSCLFYGYAYPFFFWSLMVERLAPDQLLSLERLLCLSEHEQILLDMLLGASEASEAYFLLRLQVRSALEASGQSSRIPVPDYAIAGHASFESLVAEDLLNAMQNQQGSGPDGLSCRLAGWMQMLNQSKREQLPCDWSKVLFASDAQGHCRLERALEHRQLRHAEPFLALLRAVPATILARIRPPAALVERLQDSLLQGGEAGEIRSGQALLAALKFMQLHSLPLYEEIVDAPPSYFGATVQSTLNRLARP
jgi:hypothetical protein